MLSKLSTATTKSKYPPTIMSILNFKSADLTANRAGTLSKRQQRIAEASLPNTLIQVVLLGHVAAIIGFLIMIVLASGVSSEKLLFLGVISMVIISPFLYAMGRITAIKKVGLSADDLASGKVLSVCGTIECFPPAIPTQSARIKINKKSFTVPNPLLALLDADQSYCVYYASESKRILSLEIAGVPTNHLD